MEELINEDELKKSVGYIIVKGQFKKDLIAIRDAQAAHSREYWAENIIWLLKHRHPRNESVLISRHDARVEFIKDVEQYFTELSSKPESVCPADCGDCFCPIKDCQFLVWDKHDGGVACYCSFG